MSSLEAVLPSLSGGVCGWRIRAGLLTGLMGTFEAVLAVCRLALDAAWRVLAGLLTGLVRAFEAVQPSLSRHVPGPRLRLRLRGALMRAFEAVLPSLIRCWVALRPRASDTGSQGDSHR